MKKLLNAFLLIFLCLRLVINLSWFGLTFAWLKIKTKHFPTSVFVASLIIIWLINWRLWQNKKPGQIEVWPAISQNEGEIRFELNQVEAQELLNLYQQVSLQQAFSRDLLFNQAKLLEIDNKMAADEKFTAAIKLDPNF